MSNKRSHDDEPDRRVRQCVVVVDWLSFPVELLLKCFFIPRCAHIGTICKLFHAIYYQHVVRCLHVPFGKININLCYRFDFRCDVIVYIKVNDRETWPQSLVDLHRFLIFHNCKSIPSVARGIYNFFEDATGVWNTTLMSPSYELEPNLTVSLHSSYLCVASQVTGVKNLKLTMGTLRRDPLWGKFPPFVGLETLQIWHKQGSFRVKHEEDFGSFHNNLFTLLTASRPATLFLTSAIWSHYKKRLGIYHLPLTNIRIK